MRRDASAGFHSTLLVIAFAISPACHTFLGPSAVDDNWRVHEGPRVTFFVRPGSVGEQNASRLSEVIEDQYSATVAALRLSYAGHVRAFVHDSAADADLPSNFSGRAYPETESFRFVCVAPVTGSTFALMSHEANHVFIINGLGRAGTFLMTEGLATAALSEKYHFAGRHFQFPWTRSHRSQLPALSRLIDDAEWLKVPEDIAYGASASFLAWLLDTYGSDSLRRIYAAASSELADRIASVYSRPLESLEADWLRFCESWVG